MRSSARAIAASTSSASRAEAMHSASTRSCTDSPTKICRVLKHWPFFWFSQLPAEEVSEHSEILRSKSGEDRDEEAANRTRCDDKQAKVVPRFVSCAGITPQREKH